MANVSETSELSLYIAPYNDADAIDIYIAPYDDADAIDIDDFELELAALEAYEGRTCDKLLVNGAADLPGFAYPFYSDGGSISVVADADSPTRSSYFRNTLRASTWSS
eukprot:CAMPEP_0178802954 /NCGR_PEP_ID=MMETSP0745-20121128/14186_1 /TAXON_ID=913974 /ORGANISM="Nitzschia punctata, Strain CCMP561" /LENGTH=107 /DNA_ID=CAMNT_0020461951 /DNA_START=242 /DNA_END=561 /DNA_ORIENTATION=-